MGGSMASGSRKRTRGERVAALELPPNAVGRAIDSLHRGEVLVRLGLCVLLVFVLWAVTGGWAPPFGFRAGYTPPRDIVARVDFERRDEEATNAKRNEARGKTCRVYRHDAARLAALREELIQRVVAVTGAETFTALDKEIWDEFFLATPTDATPPTAPELEQHFVRFHTALPNQEAVMRLDRAVTEALSPFEQSGLLKDLPKDPKEQVGNPRFIIVLRKNNSENKVAILDVLVGNAESIKRSLTASQLDAEVVYRVFDWLRPRLPTTLSFLPDETQTRMEDAAAKVEDVKIHYKPSDLLAPAGKPLTESVVENLRLEYENQLRRRTFVDWVKHSLAMLGMFVALAILCGAYLVVYEGRMLADLRRFASLLALVVIAIGVAVLAANSGWRGEIIPMLLFGMTVAIAYHQEMALLLTATATLGFVTAIGQGLSEFVILGASTAVGIMLVGKIRSRRKLTYVGMACGAVAALTTLGVETLEQQPFQPTILAEMQSYGLCAVVAGLLMTALLPFIENLFGVQTEISLLELGDIAHPLLQELVRRAPGTYNHSINVASLAESAAESIGAHGLLCRVGAYFHDIGKMLKPGYFVENQGSDGNRHESLLPAMSTLIIIAHIKDGADLARQHHLPEPIIDFILQHHGTTLVEYFYRRASEQSSASPDGSAVEESAYRYPGPKPQSREAAVLMVADAAESACRTLVEPTPGRIESLVHGIAMKRLLDGQFDESGLTLQELATIEQSLVKSLSAVYHGRVKYPDQRTA